MKTYKHNETLVTEYARENFIDKTFKSKNFGEFKVVGIYDTYTNNHRRLLRYICKFLKTGYETLALSNAIKKGNVKDRYAKFLCGIGYAGDYEGEYSKHSLYVHWAGMIERCYNEKYSVYRERGKVDEAWHSFSNFIEDCKCLHGYKEMKEYTKVKFSIDKDFIKEGNQTYSKKYCCFIPQALNTYIMNTNKNREYNFENEFSFLSDELKQIVYARVKLKHGLSKKELNRALKDGYFNSLIKERMRNNV